MGDWKEDAIRHKYDPLPDEPRHRKKSKRRHVRSDHKHDYERVCVNAGTAIVGHGPLYYVFERCKTCGRLGNLKGCVDEVPKDMPFYDVGGIEGLWVKELKEELRVR